MAKAAKKKPARKRSTKPAVGGAIVAKRAAAYSDRAATLRLRAVGRACRNLVARS
jgi:hypothetical protein